LASTPAWTAESDQGSAYFGTSVAMAGDINGDGYSDVIVGAYNPFSFGRAYVFLGSSSGLGTTPAWTADGDQLAARFGFSVSTAGDINSDGYSDILIGSPSYSAGQNHEGRAYLYLGSASGLPTASAWTAESDQPGAN